jgi:nucleoside-diphosphate-sugar epimerase
LETQAHIKKAQILFGFTPKISLEEGLEAQVRWHKEQLLPHLSPPQQ